MSVRVTFLVLLVVCLVGIAFAKKCYQCTTLEEGCDNVEVLNSKFLTLCPPSHSKSCRTIAQKVQGDKRIVRQCSNITRAEDMRCEERLGTSKVKVIYCHCKEDGCNAAAPLASSFGLAALLAVLAKLLV